MQVIVAKNGGFCFGVARAVEKTNEILQKKGSVCTLGEIIHNPSVVNDLCSRGAKIVNSVLEVEVGQTLVIRSHGAAPEVFLQAQELGIEVADATCPFVKRVHERVESYSNNGYDVIIVGDPCHPEVIGTKGYCKTNAQVVDSIEVAKQIEIGKKACVVSQTTLSLESFEAITNVLKTRDNSIEVFNCICQTTQKRQLEAEEIAKKSDCVLVVGGKNSSNTQKLADICKKYCKNIISIERFEYNLLEKVKIYDIIGIVVGASTPNRIILEVVTRMSELDKNEMTNEGIVQDTAVANLPAQEADDNAQELSFLEAFEKTLVRIRNGQVLKGTVVQIADNEVCVNIGYKSDGFIPRSEFASDPDIIPSEVVKVGDELEVEVLKVNDGEGNVLLSRKNVESKLAWDGFVDAVDGGNEVFDIVPKEVVKGGIIGYISGVRTFIPAAQVAIRYVENLGEYVGKTMRVKILEIDRTKRRVVASAKILLKEEASAKKKAIWEKIVVGENVSGIVRRLTDFGAFVDVGGVDGLVHVTELAWGRVKHPSDVLAIDQEIDVVILAADPEKERISLGYKQLLPKPWKTASDRYQAGEIVEGKVVRIVPFGAFVALEPTIDGLVHISQIATKRIAKVEDELKIGDIIRCKILEVNPEAKRISLSRREVLLEEQPPIEDIILEVTDVNGMHDDLSGISIESATTSLADLFANINVDTDE